MGAHRPSQDGFALGRLAASHERGLALAPAEPRQGRARKRRASECGTVRRAERAIDPGEDGPDSWLCRRALRG